MTFLTVFLIWYIVGVIAFTFHLIVAWFQGNSICIGDILLGVLISLGGFITLFAVLDEYSYLFHKVFGRFMKFKLFKGRRQKD